MAAVTSVGEIEGVRETLATLRKIEPALARQAVKDIKAPAMPAAAALRAVAPAVPLSGMGNYGPVKTSANYGGRKSSGARGQEWPLVRIKLGGPGWTVASDMARNETPGESMTTNLTAKYGGASRWAWPTVEQHLSQIQAAIAHAVQEIERLTTAAMKG